MRDFQVLDISERDLQDRYDIMLFSHSEETRCTTSLDFLEKQEALRGPAHRRRRAQSSFLLSMPKLGDALDAPRWSELTKLSDAVAPMSLEYRETEAIWAALGALEKAHSSWKVFVDYSSMPPAWYSALIEWARQLPGSRAVELDFWYTIPGYVPEKEFYPLQVRDVLPIPGCEGPLPDERMRTPRMAIFGLGFDGIVASEVYEDLQQPTLFAYYADPVPLNGYAERARKENRRLLQSSARAPIPLPLCSIGATYSYLAEMAMMSLHHGVECSFVPMGPKPHVLSALLVALRYGVACYHPTGRRDKPISTEASSYRVLTRVVLRPVRKP